MSHFKCQKCCRKNVTPGSIQCSYCNNDSKTGAGVYGNSPPEQPEIAVPGQRDEASASRNQLVLKCMPLDLSVTEQNREGNKSNYQTVKNIVQELRANKQNRREVSKKTDKNRDLIQETSVAANRMPPGNNQPLDLRKTFLKNESHWNICQFQGPQKDNTPINIAFLNNELQWNRSDNFCSSVPSHGPNFSPLVEDSRGLNTLGRSQNHSGTYGVVMVDSDPSNNRKKSASNYIFMNETNPDDKIFKSKIFRKRGIDVSADSPQDTNYDKTLGFNATRQVAFHNRAVAGIDRQHIESHYDLSKIAQNNSGPSYISDVVASNSFYYSDGKYAASGSSGNHSDENTPNVIGKRFQSSNKGNIKSIKYEEIKALVCRTCEDEIFQHETEKNVLIGLFSLYYNTDGTILLFHRSTHVPKTTCTVCGKEHAVENSHNNEHRCPHPKCKETFPCRTLFYQHIPEHREYFHKHCWVCIRTFKEHTLENNSSYICCVCGFQSENQRSLEYHHLLHLPRSFCNLCEKEYPADEKTFHGRKVKCFVCNDIFKCRIQLEEHFEGHVKYFSEQCRISESKVNNPSFRCPFNDCFETLSEVNFKNHIYLHAGLKVFKCETCGRRFPKNMSLNGHFQSCKALPYKCEICETRFHTINLLHSHGLVKHAG